MSRGGRHVLSGSRIGFARDKFARTIGTASLKMKPRRSHRLFNNFEPHMRNLAKDIVAKGEVYETPLVSPDGDKFVVFDGNRRVTCLQTFRQTAQGTNCRASRIFH